MYCRFFSLILYLINVPAYNGYRRLISSVNNEFTTFNEIKNFQLGSTPVNESAYGWIARVVHSRQRAAPHVCTAACVGTALFVTAARCVVTLKVKHTSIVYNGNIHRVLAMITPSSPTKQMFDDIGIIVTEDNKKTKWEAVPTFQGERYGEDFAWFDEVFDKEFNNTFTVVGYAIEQNKHRAVYPATNFHLTELEVHLLSAKNCSWILTAQNLIPGFKVPCYYSCSLEAFIKNPDNCEKHHGALGGALISKNNRLIGIAIWASYSKQVQLPVGVAIVNSKSYKEDLACAKKIRDNSGGSVKKGFYQGLCDAS